MDIQQDSVSLAYSSLSDISMPYRFCMILCRISERPMTGVFYLNPKWCRSRIISVFLLNRA